MIGITRTPTYLYASVWISGINTDVMSCLLDESSRSDLATSEGVSMR